MRMAALAILSVCMAVNIFGQASPTQSTFEVASVKPSAPDVAGMFVRPLAGGGLQVTGATLKNLISLAYDVRPFQISFDSKWIDTERYDIDARSAAADAKAPSDPARMAEDRRKIFEGLRSLLTDRFQLLLHSETKEQAVYTLVVKKGGPKLKESPDPRSLIRKMGRGTLKGQAVGLGMLALNLSNELERRVIDKTELAGKYDFELNWTSLQASAEEPDGPSIFTALQEQLGLRLESGKGPAEVLVIDRAERPSKN